MQILLNSTEVSDVVLGYVKDQLGLDDTNNFNVECHEDGTIAVYVNEDSGNEPQVQSDKPAPRRRQRRSKPADAVAQEPEGKQTTSVTPATTTTVETATASEPVTQEAAGETTQEPSAPGTEVEPDQQTPVDPQPEMATTVAVVEPVQESEAQASEPVLEEEAPPRKGPSLFANLRKPNNG